MRRCRRHVEAAAPGTWSPRCRTPWPPRTCRRPARPLGLGAQAVPSPSARCRAARDSTRSRAASRRAHRAGGGPCRAHRPRDAHPRASRAPTGAPPHTHAREAAPPVAFPRGQRGRPRAREARRGLGGFSPPLLGPPTRVRLAAAHRRGRLPRRPPQGTSTTTGPDRPSSRPPPPPLVTSAAPSRERPTRAPPRSPTVHRLSRSSPADAPDGNRHRPASVHSSDRQGPRRVGTAGPREPETTGSRHPGGTTGSRSPHRPRLFPSGRPRGRRNLADMEQSTLCGAASRPETATDGTRPVTRRAGRVPAGPRKRLPRGRADRRPPAREACRGARREPRGVRRDGTRGSAANRAGTRARGR